jgi:hypothetical protein
MVRLPFLEKMRAPSIFEEKMWLSSIPKIPEGIVVWFQNLHAPNSQK